MTEEEFYFDYFKGRKDFSNADLKGIDFFTPILRRTHPDFFDKKLSNLVLENDAIIHKAIEGVDFNGFDLSDSSFMGSKLLRVNIILSSLERVDGRFVEFLGSSFSELDFTGADLRFAIFTGATIRSTNFHKAKLDNAIFDFSNIADAEFSDCSAVSLKIDRSAVLNSNFDRCDLTNAGLNESEIGGCYFDDCNLYRSRLKSTKFLDCSLNNCNVSGSIIDGSSFERCVSERSDYSLSKIRKSRFIGSSYSFDSFSESDISNTKIIKSNFESVNLVGAILKDNLFDVSAFLKPVLGETSFINMDLSFVLGKYALHTGPSSIDHKSLIKTILLDPADLLDVNPHTDLLKFLELSGMAPIIAVYMIDSVRACSTNQLRELMSSTFISYGGPDEDFARKLNSDLTKYEVNTFFFPLDATFGEKLHSTMHRINDYDRTILVCSKESLDRPGLLYELEKTIEREAREGGKSYLIPIALDDYVFSEWKPEREHLRAEILNRVVADFTKPECYDQQFQRLLRSLDKLKSKHC